MAARERLARPPVRRRGLPGQKPRREVEQVSRKAAVSFLRWASRHGLSPEEGALRLGVPARTVRRWCRRWKERELRSPIPRGRPPEHVDERTRRWFLAAMFLLGPETGLPTLQRLFPQVARGELVELQRRYRRAWRRKQGLLAKVLHWTRPGSVWAMDFTEPDNPIEGIYPEILAVRDLGSGYTLAALPALAEDTATTMGLLGAMTRVHGTPLVLKMDNGSAFRSYDVKTWARANGVLPLYSPPYVPAYNGSIEAGGGSLKVRAHHQSVRHGRPGEWTCDDVEAARLQGNETGRPWGRQGPTPDEVWHSRAPISDNERAAFLDTYLAHARAERRERGMGEHEVLSHEEQSAVDRMAISRALIDHGLLKVRTRRITPPVVRAKTAKIT